MFDRETFIYGASLAKGIRKNEFNSHLNNWSSRFRAFPDATLHQMGTYILPTLRDDKPDIAIIVLNAMT